MSVADCITIARRPRKLPNLPDLRHIVSNKRSSSLYRRCTTIIGDDGTGRRTMLRRFRHMVNGPFHYPENSRAPIRALLVNLGERPSIRNQEFVFLDVSILNFEQLDFRTIYQIIANLNSFLVMFDVGDENTFYTAIQCMVKITDCLVHNLPRFILVGNKIDLSRHEVSLERADSTATTCKAEYYYECSALRNLNMNEVFDAVLILAISRDHS